MLSIRRANFDDALHILEWRNDPVSRSMSRDTDVIREDDHLRWFGKALERDDKVFFIGEVDGERVGMMRFDKIDGRTWEVSHNMAPAARGRGLGQLMVRSVLETFECPYVVAEIREDNPSCWHIYQKAGFDLTSTDGVSRHYVLDRSH